MKDWLQGLGLVFIGLGIVSVLANDHFFNKMAPESVALWVRQLQAGLITGGIVVLAAASALKGK